MQIRKQVFNLMLVCSLVLPFPAWANLPDQVNNQKVPSLAPMLQKIMPGVVNIFATGRQPPEEKLLDEENETPKENKAPSKGEKSYESLGSGVIVDAKQGYIITNAHLIDLAKSIMVTLSDGRRFKAKLIGSDPASDIAVLQIKAENLYALTLGDSDKLQVGDFVVAIGNPYGLNQTVTSGIVSALERADLGIEGYENFIQTDASINPGNSGGALVNLNGEVIGINTAILAPNGGNIGIGFAIPSNMAKNLVDELIKHGTLGRGMVGVMIQSLTPEIAHALNEPNAKGAIVTSVSPDSPASKAGIIVGDVIQKINQKQIFTAGQVRNAIGLMRTGSQFDIQILRDGKHLHFRLTSEDPEGYKKAMDAKNPFLNGVIMKNFEAEIPNFGHLQGVQVLQATDSSPAWQAGIRAGDIILSANSLKINKVDDLQKVDTKSDEVLLNIFRGNGAIFVVVNK